MFILRKSTFMCTTLSQASSSWPCDIMGHIPRARATLIQNVSSLGIDFPTLFVNPAHHRTPHRVPYIPCHYIPESFHQSSWKRTKLPALTAPSPWWHKLVPSFLRLWKIDKKDTANPTQQTVPGLKWYETNDANNAKAQNIMPLLPRSGRVGLVQNIPTKSYARTKPTPSDPRNLSAGLVEWK